MRGFDVLPERLEAAELRREAALAGRVDDEDDFALERREVVGLPLLCVGGFVLALSLSLCVVVVVVVVER